MDYTSGGPVGGRPNHAKFSVPADMVALEKIQEPWYNQRLATNDMRLTIYGGPQATTKVAPARAITLAPPAQRWKPRGGRGFAVWRADLADRLSTHDLLDTSCTDPPTLGGAEKTWAGCSADDIFAFYKDACAEYKAENTAVFHVVMSTIDLSGIREETDIAFITRHFHEGGERDGNGLLKWCEQFADHTDTGEQDRLQILLAETKLSGHGVTVVMLEKHAVELLSIWSKIAGNDIAAPASYYSRLLSSIPPGINGAVGTLRSWLADKITDGAPFLSEPEKFIDKLLAHARTLGIPAQSAGTGGSVYAMGAGNNNCKFCSSRVCGYINKPPVSEKKYCVIFNAAKPIPESASDVERNYIKINRAYVAKFEPSKVKGMSQYEMKQKLGWNEADSAAVVNPVISNRTAFDAWLAENGINNHRVAMIVSPSSPSVAEEGGLLAPEMASPLRAMRATNANMRSPSSAAIPSRRPSVHAPMVVAPAPQAGLSYLFQRPSMQTLLELTGLLLRRLKNIDRSSLSLIHI